MICLVLTILANLFPAGEHQGRLGPVWVRGGACLKSVLSQPTAA